jgi:hypothetical protein
MSISVAPPAPPKKKRGMGCLGCGCLILILLVVLFLALIGGSSYVGYNQVLSVTSDKPAVLPNFDGGDNFYATVKQKAAGFGHDLKNHQAATIQLSGDEINTLLARDPDLVAHKIHIYVALDSNQATVQGSVPTDALTEGAFNGVAPNSFAGRFVNFKGTLGVVFDPQTRNFNFTLHSLKSGNNTLPQNMLPLMENLMNSFLNAAMQKNPDAQNLLHQAKSIQIKNGQLVIETQ